MKGNAVTELLVMLVVVVITSAVVLLLIQQGVLSVKAENDQPLLNAEFIPLVRGGDLAVREFQFCGGVNAEFQCISPQSEFLQGDEVHFFFVVESSTFYGDVHVVENYRLTAPNGKVVLEIEEKNNFNHYVESSQESELVRFKDFFVLPQSAPKGEYVLELVLHNPLLAKQATIVKRVVVI